MTENREKTKLSKGMLILAYALMALALGLCIYTMNRYGKSDIKTLSPVTIFMEVLTIGAGLLYFLNDSTKNAARYFKVMMLTAAFSYLIDYIGLALFPVEFTADRAFYIEMLFTLIGYGNLLLVGAGKDLGKRITFIMLIVNACICLYGLISKLGAAPEIVAIAIEFFVMSLVSLIAARAKYIDKTNRGTK